MEHHPEVLLDIPGQLRSRDASRRGQQVAHDLLGQLERATPARSFVEEPRHAPLGEGCLG
jgi:hypothetical protein